MNNLYNWFVKSLKWVQKIINLIRDFQRETNTLLNAEKQIKREDREKEWDLDR